MLSYLSIPRNILVNSDVSVPIGKVKINIENPYFSVHPHSRGGGGGGGGGGGV